MPVPTSPATAAWSVAAHPELTRSAEPHGVLLLHGFTGSPASMRPWGEFLATKGYAVEVPLLPGHGTRWQDLNETTWRDWYAEPQRRTRRCSLPTNAWSSAGCRWGRRWRSCWPPTGAATSPA